MIHKYYYLFTRPSVIVVCWKSIFFKSLQFFQGRIIWITFGWGALGAETLYLSGVKICPWNTLGGNLGGQVENVCPLGAEKGQNLPSSALRLAAVCASLSLVIMIFNFIIDRYIWFMLKITSYSLCLWEISNFRNFWFLRSYKKVFF